MNKCLSCETNRTVGMLCEDCARGLMEKYWKHGMSEPQFMESLPTDLQMKFLGRLTGMEGAE